MIHRLCAVRRGAPRFRALLDSRDGRESLVFLYAALPCALAGKAGGGKP